MSDEPAPKVKTGRPTYYDPAICETVVELGRQGAGRYEIAAAINTPYTTMLLWEKTHPEFAEAMDHAKGYAHGWWEKRGREGVGEGTKFNAPAYALQVRNRFRGDWIIKDPEDPAAHKIAITISSDDAKL